MWKYIVTYVLIELHLVECPKAPLNPDEFGVYPEFGIENNLLCMQAVRDTISTEFISRKEAIDFIERGTRKYYTNTKLENFRIDSVKIPSVKKKFKLRKKR